ncbi:MAG: amidase domain-containing protein [Bacillota bacterium]
MVKSKQWDIRLRAALVALLITGLLVSPVAAFAYDPAGACSYADRYALSPNPNYPYFEKDCTNFVSQCLHEGGGIPFDTAGTRQWYCQKVWYGWSYTQEWTVADRFWQWLINDNYAQNLGYWNYPQPDNNSITAPGDVFLYNWNTTTDTIFDHASINAAYGTDINSGKIGDLVDQHTTNRLHAIWHLIPYNPQYQTTRIYAARPWPWV